MGFFKTILDGYSINDVATTEANDNEASGNLYNYYGYVSHDGAWVIMREKSDETEYRYCIGSSGYTTAWSARASKVFKRSNEFKRPIF